MRDTTALKPGTVVRIKNKYCMDVWDKYFTETMYQFCGTFCTIKKKISGRYYLVEAGDQPFMPRHFAYIAQGLPTCTPEEMQSLLKGAAND